MDCRLYGAGARLLSNLNNNQVDIPSGSKFDPKYLDFGKHLGSLGNTYINYIFYYIISKLCVPDLETVKQVASRILVPLILY